MADLNGLVSYNQATAQFTTIVPYYDGNYNEVYAMVRSPDGGRVYADYYELSFSGNTSPTYDGQFIEIDAATNKIIGGTPVNTNGAIAISPDGHTAYVNTFSQTGTNDITVVNLETQAVTEYPQPTYGGYFSMAVSPGRQDALWAEPGTGAGYTLRHPRLWTLRVASPRPRHPNQWLLRRTDLSFSFPTQSLRNSPL